MAKSIKRRCSTEFIFASDSEMLTKVSGRIFPYRAGWDYENSFSISEDGWRMVVILRDSKYAVERNGEMFRYGVIACRIGYIGCLYSQNRFKSKIYNANRRCKFGSGESAMLMAEEAEASFLAQNAHSV